MTEALPSTVTIWPVAQQPSRDQRRNRYVTQSIAHPGKMLPAIARHAIATFTAPNEVVVDPMCGIGTTLVEAVHLNRRAVGIEYESRWSGLANENLGLAKIQNAQGNATVHCGDAREKVAELIPNLRGKVSLLLTSPPYGNSTHGHTRTSKNGVITRDERYSDDRNNLANQSGPDLLAAFGEILGACLPLLHPQGHVVITTRPWRKNGALIDFPNQVLATATKIGLTPTQRCIALLAGIKNNQLIPRPSFFQLDHIRKARHNGTPLHIIAHEDILVLTKKREG